MTKKVIRGTVPGPRNPLAAPSLFRKAGSHKQSGKAQRAAQKRDLRKALSQI